MTRLAGSFWARLAITAAILTYLASQIDMRQASLAVLGIHPGYLALVLALVACDRTIMILRWVLLLKASGVRIASGAAARIFLVSAFVGSFLPAGVGADLARTFGLSRATSDPSEAMASVAIDRMLGIAALVATGITGLFATSTRLGDWRVTSGVALLLSASLAVVWADHLVGWLLPSRLTHHRVGQQAIAASRALGRYRTRSGTLALVFGWSLVVQLLRIVQAYFLGAGLGLDVAFRHYLVFMPVGLLILLLPISISGFGLPQGAIVWLMAPLGVDEERSFALSTLIVLTGLAGNLPGLLLWLRPRNRGHGG